MNALANATYSIVDPKKENINKFSISKVLHDLNWDSLENRRTEARLMMAFKILNHQVILEPNMLPKIRYQRPERNCKGIKVGTSNQLFEPQARLDTAETTFFYSTKKIMEFNCNHKTSRLQKC